MFMLAGKYIKWWKLVGAVMGMVVYIAVAAYIVKPKTKNDMPTPYRFPVSYAPDYTPNSDACLAGQSFQRSAMLTEELSLCSTFRLVIMVISRYHP